MLNILFRIGLVGTLTLFLSALLGTLPTFQLPTPAIDALEYVFQMLALIDFIVPYGIFVNVLKIVLATTVLVQTARFVFWLFGKFNLYIAGSSGKA